MNEIECKNIEELLQKVKETFCEDKKKVSYFEDSSRTGEMCLVVTGHLALEENTVSSTRFIVSWIDALENDEILQIREKYNIAINDFFKRQLLCVKKGG